MNYDKPNLDIDFVFYDVNVDELCLVWLINHYFGVIYSLFEKMT